VSSVSHDSPRRIILLLNGLSNVDAVGTQRRQYMGRSKSAKR
jgi:hypothetical protein